MKSLLILIASIVVCTGLSPPVKPPPVKPPPIKPPPPTSAPSDSVSSVPIKPPVLPPPPNNCSGICNKIYSPVCSGPVYGCGKLQQSGNECEFNYFNCLNVIKTSIPYEIKYKGPCYAPIAIP